MNTKIRKEFNNLMNEMSMCADDSGISQTVVDKLWQFFDSSLQKVQEESYDQGRKDERERVIKELQDYSTKIMLDAGLYKNKNRAKRMLEDAEMVQKISELLVI